MTVQCNCVCFNMCINFVHENAHANAYPFLLFVSYSITLQFCHEICNELQLKMLNIYILFHVFAINAFIIFNLCAFGLIISTDIANAI